MECLENAPSCTLSFSLVGLGICCGVLRVSFGSLFFSYLICYFRRGTLLLYCSRVWDDLDFSILLETLRPEFWDRSVT